MALGTCPTQQGDIDSCSTSRSTGCGVRRRARATRTGATAATPRASRSRRRAPTRSCSTSAPACGSGARPSPHDGTFRGIALVTHLHWDHVQGLPFFVPATAPALSSTSTGPPRSGVTLEEAFEEFMRPPYFPVAWPGPARRHRFHDLGRRRRRDRRRQGDGRDPSPTSDAPTATASSSAAPRSPTSATTSSR